MCLELGKRVALVATLFSEDEVRTALTAAGFCIDAVPDIQAALALVAAGLGINPVPAALQRFRRRGVVYRPRRPRSLKIELGLAWRRDDDSALVQQFRRVAYETARRTERRR